MRSSSKLRPRNLLWGVALVGVWGLIEIAMSVHDYGWTFHRDVQIGLCWVALAAVLLITNLRKPTSLAPRD